MRIKVRFETVDGKALKFRKLGMFFEQNQEFFIIIDETLPVKEKLLTFVEEFLHLLIRIICIVTGKRLLPRKEHSLIKDVISLLWKRVIGSNANVASTGQEKALK